MRRINAYPIWQRASLPIMAALLLASCSTEQVDAGSIEGIHSCKNNGDIKYDPNEKGDNTVVDKVSVLEDRVANDLAILFDRVTVAGAQVYRDGDDFSKTADGTYGVRIEGSDLVLNFPHGALQQDTDMKFSFKHDEPEPIQAGSIVCSDGGNLYPNGVVLMINDLMDKTDGFDAATN
jgi:hypothetical protein